MQQCFFFFWTAVASSVVSSHELYSCLVYFIYRRFVKRDVACKRTFLKSGLWVEKFESAALAFSCGRRICILCVRMMMPSAQPSTSGLRPLTPAKSHNNNNNGGLHACVCAAEDIEPIRVTRAKYSAPLPLRLAKKEYGQPACHFHLLLALFGFYFYCLFVYSVQAICASSVSSSPFLVNFAPPIGWNLN